MTAGTSSVLGPEVTRRWRMSDMPACSQASGVSTGEGDELGQRGVDILLGRSIRSTSASERASSMRACLSPMPEGSPAS